MPPPHHPALALLQSHTLTPAKFKQIHAHFITTGLALHTYPLSRLLLFSSLPPLSSTLGTSYPLSVLSQSSRPTTFLYNTLISSLASQNHTHLAISLYSHLCSSSNSLNPNAHTYPSLFKVCSTPPWFSYGLGLHTHLIKCLGETQDHFVRASLLSFYSKCGKLDVCRDLFDRIPQPDLPTWNAMLTAYVQGFGDESDAGLWMEALALFQDMQISGMRPNEISLVALVAACGDLGALGQGMWAHKYVERNGLALNCYMGTALIEMYSKCGRLDLAEHVFIALAFRDTSCYNAMIRGLAIHGHGQRAVGLFGQMKSEDVAVDDVTMVAVMCACAHVGLVNEGRRCFNSMQLEFGIKPKSEHYGCLVDLLGRAGQLEEAEEVLRNMPLKPNAVLYRSLLGACRIHDNVEIGECMISQLIELEPEHGGNYVLLSNMYAKIKRWDDVRRVRTAMKCKGIDKTPGSSLVEVDGAVHEFVIGDKRHSRSKEIHSMLDEMQRRLQEYGHKPRTEEVLFDVEEEDKEDALSYHSERVAIAFALIATYPSVPIRIIKNLRVCGDCHSSTKIISLIYKREIIVRDRTRFHHFRDGECSCLDYW